MVILLLLAIIGLVILLSIIIKMEQQFLGEKSSLELEIEKLKQENFVMKKRICNCKRNEDNAEV